ncbi:MAG TPA: NAD(P)-dependent oxidoreductase [Candidatus Dormibacteraeota bacterium]|nr:NAD(P)-dependent oxidoreductase [Candidatus Dormibacteraeota bacterium]
MQKRVLVTGASGFVGANLVRRLLREGHEVNLILRPESAGWRLTELESVAKHIVNLADAEGVMRSVEVVRPDWIFHLAAHGAYSSQTDLHEMIQTNVVGTVNLVQACLRTGFEAFVNTGSSSEYGFKDHPPAESDLLEPNSHYAVTKASATLYCRLTAQTHNVQLRTLRLYSVYGPWEEPTRLVPSLISYALKGRLPPLADPDVARDYVYVDDACDAYLLAATQAGAEPSAVLNIGTGIQSNLAQMVEVACALLEVREPAVWGSMANRRWDTNTWVADNKKAVAELGWTPQTSLVEGLAKTISWFRDHPALRTYYEQRIGLTDTAS